VLVGLEVEDVGLDPGIDPPPAVAEQGDKGLGVAARIACGALLVIKPTRIPISLKVVNRRLSTLSVEACCIRVKHAEQFAVVHVRQRSFIYKEKGFVGDRI
jgi:hypothetical protein